MLDVDDIFLPFKKEDEKTFKNVFKKRQKKNFKNP